MKSKDVRGRGETVEGWWEATIQEKNGGGGLRGMDVLILFENISQTNEKRSNVAVSLSLTCKSYSDNITFVD